MWLLKTIIVSSIIGITLGTTAGLTANLLTTQKTKLTQVQTPKIILATHQDECCLQKEEEIAEVGQEIVAAQIINGEEVKVPMETPSPTPVPTFVPKPIIKEVIFEASSSSEIALAEPTPQSEGTSLENQTVLAGLNPEIVWNLVNEYRQKLGLKSFTQDEKVCTLAKTRSAEIETEFLTGRLHSGLFNRDLPFWITENVIAVKTELQALAWWINSPIHRRQMQGDYEYSCVACQGFMCAQLFTNFTPKN